MNPYHACGDSPLENLASLPRDEDLERRQAIEFHEERLNWRLQRAFEESFPGRAFQQPRPRRARPAAAKPAGFS
jgi:hypothetical protein